VITSEFNCHDLVELVTEYLEHRLPANLRAAFDLHIAECPSCHEYLDQIRTSITLTGTIAQDDLSAAARDALTHAFHDWKKRRPGS
jgi:anti-sigma factor RsiW